MVKNIIKLFVMMVSCLSLSAQTISGTLSQLTNQEIRLEGVNGFKPYLISADNIDAQANVQLDYTAADCGVRYLVSADGKRLLVILSGADIRIVGEELSSMDRIQIEEGQGNQCSEKYAREYPRREQILSAWISTAGLLKRFTFLVV